MPDATFNPPTDLTERFRSEKEPVFEVLRTEGDLRLWKSITKRDPLSDEANRLNINYHITLGDQAEVVGMGRLETAIKNFELCAQGDHHG